MIGLILIATGKYDCFVQPLLESASKHLFTGEQKHAYLFTDKQQTVTVPDFTVSVFPVQRLPWPFPTLYRYKWMTQYAEHMTADHLYYVDVDMLFVDAVGREILPDHRDLVAVRHPGYFRGGWGDYRTTRASRAFVKERDRRGYYCGGFQGGTRQAYLQAAQMMAQDIEADEKNGAMAGWHDESHWNKHLTAHPFKELTPSYCFPQAPWADSVPFEPRILALAKDHKIIRSC